VLELGWVFAGIVLGSFVFEQAQLFWNNFVAKYGSD